VNPEAVSYITSENGLQFY